MRVRTFMDIKPTKIACILVPQVRGEGSGERCRTPLEQVRGHWPCFVLSVCFRFLFLFQPRPSLCLAFLRPTLWLPHSRTAVRGSLWREAKLGSPSAVTLCGHPGKQHTVKLPFVPSVYLPVHTDFPVLAKPTLSWIIFTIRDNYPLCSMKAC